MSGFSRLANAAAFSRVCDGWRRGAMVAAALWLTGCGQTLFQSNFDVNAINAPPATTQEVGTAVTAGPPGSVLVVAAPSDLPGRWLRLQHPTATAPLPEFAGILATTPGDGVYTFTSTAFLPSGSETATVQFESAIQGIPFMHVDLLSTNQVRIDDDESTVFGTFPRNQPFILQVTLNIDQASTAEVLLSGAGASGSRNYTIKP